MGKYIRVEDIGKVCDPGRDWGVKQFTAQEIADSMRKHGSWSDVQMYRWIYAKCSVCGAVHNTRTNYCADCGSRMDEVEE